MRQATITKRGKVWTISGLQGMSLKEFRSVISQFLQTPGLQGDTTIRIVTRQGTMPYSVADLSNDSSVDLLFQKIQ